jgi:1-acyl-sn-glycerol-3-phosphate acyltransferase
MSKDNIPGGYYIPLKNRVARVALRITFRLLFHLLARVVISGKHNIPQHGAYLVVMNHVSIYDPPFILSFWPKPLEALGASVIWDRRGQNVLVRLYNCIPVNRGKYDRQTITRAISALESGKPLVIAPEGRRSHEPGMLQALPGVAFIVDQISVPVIPVGIVGTTDDFFHTAIRGKRPTLKMAIGEPISLPRIAGKGQSRRISRQNNVDLIMSHIAKLLPPEYQGAYASNTTGI